MLGFCILILCPKRKPEFQVSSKNGDQLSLGAVEKVNLMDTEYFFIGLNVYLKLNHLILVVTLPPNIFVLCG